MVGMIFVRQIIHLSAKFFGSTNLNHSTAEMLISYKSVVDTLEELLALLLQVGDVVLLVSWLLPVTVPVRSPFLAVVVRNGKEVHRVLHEFLILLTSFSHEVAERPMSQYDKHTLHCVLGSISSNSHNSMFPTS